MRPFNAAAPLHRACAVVGLLVMPAVAADPAPPANPAAPTADRERVFGDRLDPAVVYRYDLLAATLAPIARTDLKPGHVYLRYSAARGRHVWSRVDASGRLRFAIGPGSSIPARFFDPVADQQTRRAALASRAPELARRLAIEGARPSVTLGDDGQWRLAQEVNEGRVFDLETGERHEWHLGKPVPVVHAAGHSWVWTGSGYRPPTQGYGGPEPVADPACCR